MGQVKSSDTIQDQINKIIKNRKEKCHSVKELQTFWEDIVKKLDTAKQKCADAEKNQADKLDGISARLDKSKKIAKEQEENIKKIYARYNRDTICIGVGGAARMGKSTFLQAVTGLTDQQIPTSDKGFTTAGRSLIVNDTEEYAIADMHSEETFLRNVLGPMCKNANVTHPTTLAEFAKMPLPEEGSQEQRDIRQRLMHTQKRFEEIKGELTGVNGRRIDINNLRDYVAYPTDTYNKAGKFMAVENIVIHAKFPGTGIKQLQVVDLPGLGEAGRDLAKVQTTGLSEVCDITLLIKRPDMSNADWMHRDSQALDILAASIPLLDDLSLYTMLLMNRDDRKGHSDCCLENIKKQMQQTGRNLKILDYNVTDKEAIINKAIPEILEFLAKSLPEIDRVIWQKAQKESSRLQNDICKTLKDIEKELQKVIPDDNPDAEREALKEKLVRSLITDYADPLKEDSQKPDDEWNKKIEEATQKVEEWAANGCGLGDMDKLIGELEWRIKAANGIPTDFINQIRINFRRQWEIMDDHLANRTVEILSGFLEQIRKNTYNFIPDKDEQLPPLEQIRKQLNDTADKLLSAAQTAEERETMENMAKPLRRLAFFELHSNFLFEPQLQGIADDLKQGNLDSEAAQSLAEKLLDLLHEAIRKYSETLKSTGDQKKDIEQLVMSVKTANIIGKDGLKKKIVEALEEKANSLTFSPQRIFATLIANEVDSFLRFSCIDDALRIWLKKYKSEMREAPTPAIQAASDAKNDIDKLKHDINNQRVSY